MPPPELIDFPLPESVRLPSQSALTLKERKEDPLWTMDLSREEGNLQISLVQEQNKNWDS